MVWPFSIATDLSISSEVSTDFSTPMNARLSKCGLNKSVAHYPSSYNASNLNPIADFPQIKSNLVPSLIAPETPGWANSNCTKSVRKSANAECMCVCVPIG